MNPSTSTNKKSLRSHATPIVAGLLNLRESVEQTEEKHTHNEHSAHISKTAPGPGNLPIIDAPTSDNNHPAVFVKEPNLQHKKPDQDSEHILASQPAIQKQKPVMNVLKTIMPYAAVFGFGLLIYYFFLGSTDFTNFLSKLKPASQTVSTPKETALLALQKNNLDAYYKWIGQYYFDVSDPAITDPNADNSGNGLSNFQKFLIGLNPKSYDTLGLGMADSQALASGINPLTGGSLTDAQKNIIDKYFDMEAVMNKLALNRLHASSYVAGAVNSNPSLNSQINARGTGGLAAQPVLQSPNTGADLGLALLDIDENSPGLLEIPSLNVKAPLIWTKDPKNFDLDLQSGVVHYPGTAMPGQIGTTYISGHSSNVPWAKGSYNQVFAKLGDLADNASFTITVYTKQGKAVKYHYVVTRRGEYKATDQEQFKNSGTKTVALSTCWPVNTTQKRLVVFGEQTQVEQ